MGYRDPGEAKVEAAEMQAKAIDNIAYAIRKMAEAIDFHTRVEVRKLDFAKDCRDEDREAKASSPPQPTESTIQRIEEITGGS